MSGAYYLKPWQAWRGAGRASGQGSGKAPIMQGKDLWGFLMGSQPDTPPYTETRHQELMTDMLMSPGCRTES